MTRPTNLPSADGGDGPALTPQDAAAADPAAVGGVVSGPGPTEPGVALLPDALKRARWEWIKTLRPTPIAVGWRKAAPKKVLTAQQRRDRRVSTRASRRRRDRTEVAS